MYTPNIHRTSKLVAVVLAWVPCTAVLFAWFVFKDLFIIIHKYNVCSCFQTHQKRGSDLIMDGCEPSCGSWDLNSGPLEEQPVLLPAEPFHQPKWCALESCVRGFVYQKTLICPVVVDKDVTYLIL